MPREGPGDNKPRSKPQPKPASNGVGASIGSAIAAGARNTAPIVSPAQDYGAYYGGDVYGSADPYAVAEQIVADNNLAGASEREVIDWIYANMPLSMARLLDVPELQRAIIDAARRPDATPESLLAAVEGTEWWRSRSDSMREFDALLATDPTEFNAQVDRRMAELIPEWEAYGVDGDIRQTAINSMRLGYNSDQIRLIMAEALQRESSATGLDGQGAADADALQQIAREEYLTRIDRQTAERWAIRAVRQGASIEDEWRSYLATVASSRFGIQPGSGVTPADVMAPVKAAIAESLEMSADAIDLLDPRWVDVLQVEGTDGRFRPMTQYEAIQWARSRPEFQRTGLAVRETASLADTIGRAFGQVA